MAHIDHTAELTRCSASEIALTQPAQRQALVLIVTDDLHLSMNFGSLCGFLNIDMEHVPSDQDLAIVLREQQPMAVIADLDGNGQDGYHVMMQVAEYDRELPMLLLTGRDPALAGAADAIEELWQLTSVAQTSSMPSVGNLVDFLFRAGRKGRCMRMMPV